MSRAGSFTLFDAATGARLGVIDGAFYRDPAATPGANAYQIVGWADSAAFKWFDAHRAVDAPLLDLHIVLHTAGHRAEWRGTFMVNVVEPTTRLVELTTCRQIHGPIID